MSTLLNTLPKIVHPRNEPIATLEEVKEAFPRALSKMEGYIEHFGNDDGRYDDDYLTFLVMEDIQIQRLQADLESMYDKNEKK